jgi:hypothetical protein
MLEINALANSTVNDNEIKKFETTWGKYDPEVIY